MFERTRKDLVDRLGNLIGRYEAIALRANDWLDKARQAERLGLKYDTSQPLLHEIAMKANQQAAVCGESITHLLRDRALPLIFKKAVAKAEALAQQSEAILAEFDEAERMGKQAFRERMERGD